MAKKKEQAEFDGMPRDPVGKAAHALKSAVEDVKDAQEARNTKEQELIAKMEAKGQTSVNCEGFIFKITLDEPVKKIKIVKQKSHD